MLPNGVCLLTYDRMDRMDWMEETETSDSVYGLYGDRAWKHAIFF